ncbi:hypothetical protein [Deinococcus sp.]|uniref:hypothetical protein n=1 Tax=Deinococcus sp. TaxID=47478 RepID=UPI003B58DC6B
MNTHSSKQETSIVADLLTGVYGGLVAMVAGIGVIYGLLEFQASPWWLVPLVALLTAALAKTALEQVNVISERRLYLPRTTPFFSWAGAVLSLLLVMGDHWAAASGFERWLQTQASWWAFWNW